MQLNKFVKAKVTGASSFVLINPNRIDYIDEQREGCVVHFSNGRAVAVEQSAREVLQANSLYPEK